MRVTNNMMSNAVILQLRKQNELLFEAQNKIASGKRLNKPSDNPTGMGHVLDYRSKLLNIEQYQENIKRGKTLIEANELTLELIDDLIGDTAEMAETYRDTSLSDGSRTIGADAIRNMYDQIVQLANSKFGDKYVFSGDQTTTPPFGHAVRISDTGATIGDIEFGLTADATDVTIEISDASNTVVRTITVGGGGTEGSNAVAWDGLDDGGGALPDGLYTFTIGASDSGDPVEDYAAYHGDDGEMQFMIGENLEVSLDADGRNFFTPTGGVNVFQVLKELVAAMENPDIESGNRQITAAVSQLDQAHSHLQNKRTEYLPKLYQFGHSDNHWTQVGQNIETAIADLEEADLTQTAVELQRLQLAYETTIATAAKILQPGLLNFLR
jgi:flagellar hook-associated protein 3